MLTKQWIVNLCILGGVWFSFGFNTVQAGIIPLLSGANLDTSVEGNNITGSDVIPSSPYGSPQWAAPTSGGHWVSFAQTGPGGIPVASDPLTGGNSGQIMDGYGPTATFYLHFTLDNPSVLGSILTINADDTAAVFLDGTEILAIADTLGYTDYCTNTGIGCTSGSGINLTNQLVGLNAGDHTLTFQVYQLWGNAFGLLYEGQIVTEAAPEPGTLAFGGIAIVMLGLWRRRSMLEGLRR